MYTDSYRTLKISKPRVQYPWQHVAVLMMAGRQDKAQQVVCWRGSLLVVSTLDVPPPASVGTPRSAWSAIRDSMSHKS